jgi:hypothetical protein
LLEAVGRGELDAPPLFVAYLEGAAFTLEQGSVNRS